MADEAHGTTDYLLECQSDHDQKGASGNKEKENCKTNYTNLFNAEK